MAKGIYKRGNVYWVRYAGIDGRTITESSQSYKFKDAQELLEERKRARREGKFPDAKTIPHLTFNEFAAEYLVLVENQKSIKSKRHLINQLCRDFGNLPLRSFNTLLIKLYKAERLKRNKPATVNRLLATISHIFQTAVDCDKVEEDVLKRIRKVKMEPENNKRMRFLSPEECQALICNCHDHLRPIVITALNTGMRKGEILGLKWDNVDLKNGLISLNQDQTKNAERKDIPINDTLKAVLLGITRRLDVPYVFFDNATGKPFGDVKRSFHTALKNTEVQKCTKCNYQKAKDTHQKEIEYCPLCNSEMMVQKGITDFHFHDIRHTFASHLVMSGADIMTVKELLGHKKLTMTLRYSHLAQAHKAHAVDLLDKKLTGKPTIQLLFNSGTEG